MPLDSDAQALGRASRNCRALRQVYLDRFRHANSELQRLGWAADVGRGLYRSLVPGGVWLNLATGVDPAFAALATTLAEPVGIAARDISIANQDLVRRMSAIRDAIQSLTGRLASQKTAENVATELRVADAENEYCRHALSIHQSSLWGRYDPVRTPLVLLAFQTPTGSDTASWIQSAYERLAGQAYAQEHPLVDPPSENDTTPEFSLGSLTYVLPVALGVVGGIGVIWLLRKVGM